MRYIACIIFLAFISLSGCKKEVIVVSKSIIVGWGDDLTYGVAGKDTTYLTELARLTGLQTYNLGFAEKSSTQIKNRMLADTTLHSYPTVIWISKDVLSNSVIKADIQEMVNSLGHKNYLVLGLVNDHSGNEEKGDIRYNNIIRLNKELAEQYSEHFIDIRSFLISQYDKNVPQDVKDHNVDVLPLTLREGSLNLNAKAFNLIAGYINTKIKVLRGDATTPTK